MQKSVIVLSRSQRRRLLRLARKTRDADLRVRYMIIVHTSQGKSQSEISSMLGCSVATVKRTRTRWRDSGEAGLIDRREEGGCEPKANDAYAADLLIVLKHTPQKHGERRSNWTQELLIKVMCTRGHELISRTTMSRLLKRLGVRRGNAKPYVECPWGRRRKACRIRMIRKLVSSLPSNEAAVWEDEVDIHLNPRIGPDWMLPGVQRRVLTPGKNVKRFIAGAMDAITDRMIWVSGVRKTSTLFIELMKKLLKTYSDRKVIHVILDNYQIHSSKQVQTWLREFGGKIRLHFLPPYCPDDNRIERKAWREVHANVTRNHDCRTIDELMTEVVRYLMTQNRAAKKGWLRCA